ncbi:MAG TPA: DUF192 domain-containing protein [Dehalococcoidia bacterium]|jgi:uncharacterized membrane protein (UPF0127 family)|nr:DUF192 domain-containing protein [Dehalococcoidia bacterium]
MAAIWAALTVAAAAAGLVLVTALLIGTCGSSTSIDREPLTIIAANGTTARLEVEIADTADERATGLMGRTDLPPDTGMLFVFEQPGRGFYMKDTRLALTAAFIAECGEILALVDLEPLSEEIKNISQPYAYGLEVDQGWFERNGIAVGDIVSLPRDIRPENC